MINPLIAALGLDLDLSAEEIADVIWLATQMQQSVPMPPRSVQAAPQTTPRNNPFIPSKPRSEQKPQEEKADVSQGEGNPTLGQSQELSFQVPDVRSLREPLTLARSLRPLLRRIALGNSTVLNEAATIQRIVEEQLWIPVLQPSLEPWLDLALVVDESDSMLIWRRTIIELQRLLENYGVFRTVRVWGLVGVEGQVKIRTGFGIATRHQRNHSPSELIDPNGRCLVLVVSDCIAPLWQSGQILPALKAWSQCGAMAIVQMLPEWLWRRTALGLATAVQLRALAPGLPNQQLTVSASESWDEADLETGIKVPVITLEPELFATWTQVVAGKGGVWTPGVVFEPTFAAMEEEDDRPLTDMTAEQRVQRFRLTASPMARRLAGLLAAAPVISLPIVRIVQDRLLNQSRQVHLAEVFLGGLLKPLMVIAPDTNPDKVQYDFFEGVREVLLESVPLPDSVDVLDEVSKFVASRLGLSLEAFAAVLRNPQQVQTGELAGQMRPFARVTAQVLKRMGGEYAKFAVELELGAESGRSKRQPLSLESKRQPLSLEQPEGTMDAESDFYVVRSEDAIALDTIKLQGVTITIKGSRQMGKSSLLIRTMAVAAEIGKRVAFLDFQLFDKSVLTDGDRFFRQFCAWLTDELELDNRVEEFWSLPLGNSQRCTRYMQRYLLKELGSPLVLAMDEVESVFDTEFRSDFFSMLRSWHNSRVMTPIWKQLDLVLVTSTEPYQWIENLNQSPFNVGQVIELTDFSVEQVNELNQRHGIPLNPQQVEHFMDLLGGHPYLVQRALYLLSSRHLTVAELFAEATADRGPFDDHLRYHLFRMKGKKDLIQGMLQVIRDQTCTVERVCFKLRRAGLVRQEGRIVLPRCQLYADYFREHLREASQEFERQEVERLANSPVTKLTILILTANSQDSERRRLDQEVRDIAEGLQRSQQRDQFQLQQQWAVRLRDIQRAMLDIKPSIVHFSGHGGEPGLAFENEMGETKLVNGDALTGLFQLFADRVECVVLNGCCSKIQADAIAQCIPYVIGIDQAVGDRAAIEFTVGFYDALGAGRSIEFAYELACNAIQLDGIPEHLTPVLKKKSNLA